MNKPPKHLSAKKVHSGNYFSVIREELELSDGKTVSRERVEHRGAVVIIPITATGELLMIQQYRFAVRKTLLEFPAGTLEVGEPPVECAKREIQEEVGQKAESWTPLGTMYPAPGFCDEIQYLYAAKNLSPSSGELDEDEIIEVVRVNPRDLDELVSSGKLCDGKSIAAAYRARIAGLF